MGLVRPSGEDLLVLGWASGCWWCASVIRENRGAGEAFFYFWGKGLSLYLSLSLSLSLSLFLSFSWLP